MKRVEYIVKHILTDIEKKKVLEVACGCAEFSLAASSFGQSIDCMDIDDSRLTADVKNNPDIKFSIMDATNITYDNNSFDTIVLYNAIGHLGDCFEKAIEQIKKVQTEQGVCYIISSSKMDKNIINSNVIPYLKNIGIHYDFYSYKMFDIVKF